VIDPEEADSLKVSVDFLLRVRNHLHLTCGKKCDRLLFPHQSELAAFFGLSGNGAAPVEAFMRLYHLHSERVAHLCRLGLRRVRREGVAALSQAPVALDAASIGERPGELMRLFAEAAAADGEPAAGVPRLVRHSLPLLGEPFRRSPAVARHFLGLLCAPAAARALENMLHLGLLGAYIPEFETIRFLVQHDGYHVHTADIHSVATVAELAGLQAGLAEGPEPVLTGLMREVERPELLFLAALLHDIGKGGEERHEICGARLARGVGERMGLPEADVSVLAKLVELHLVLSEAAQRSDLGDEDFLRQLAARIPPGLLKLLYLLTYADSRATGPASWTAWRSALIQELFFKLQAVLERPAGEAAEAGPEAVREDVVARLARELSPERVAWHMSQLPAEYLSATDTETAADQILLAEALLRGVEPLAWSVRTSGGLSLLSLCALDRPGLLAKAAGLFALHGLSIHEARLYTRRDAIVVDTFRLSPVLREAPAPDWPKVMADLAAGLTGRISLPYRLAKRFRPSPLERTDLPRLATEVHVDNGLSTLNTAIEVRTRDRVGLLYLLARVLFDLELNIYVARVTTKGHQACDVFFVRDFSGNKVFDPGHIEETERAIRFALDG